MFTADTIANRLLQRPFFPVRIVMSSGDYFDIYHPDLVLVGQDLLVVGTTSQQNPRYAERFSQLAIAHVTAMENLPPPPPKPASAGAQATGS